MADVFRRQEFFYAVDSKNLIAHSAALLGTIYWWNSLPREMFFYGMIGFSIASYLSIWGVSLFYPIASQGRVISPLISGGSSSRSSSCRCMYSRY
jgi:hypothetical protein